MDGCFSWSQSRLLRTHTHRHTHLYYTNDDTPSALEHHKQAWLARSLQYYSKVMREDRRHQAGQIKGYNTPEYQDEFTLLANKHFFALRKIKDGKPRHAERIYRRIIFHELQRDEAVPQLAITTLLLALLLQREGANVKETRSVFLHFFRVAMLENRGEECACSAKVMQAFALFEMKQGSAIKSLQLAEKAVLLDPTLTPVLNWKQFRDAYKKKQ
jgi:hypothetical protein